MSDSQKQPLNPLVNASIRDNQAHQETPVQSNDQTRDDLSQLLKRANDNHLETSKAIEECHGLAERLRDAGNIKRLAESHSEERDFDCSEDLGQFELLESIGRGGMGQVWKARHRRLGKIQAVKIIHPDRSNSAEVLQRFHREMQAIGRLEHPNIVAAQHADEVDGKPFLVMEYVDGKSLSEITKDHQKSGRPIEISSACEWIRQAALGIEYAHERGVLHRDIKPANIMLNRSGTIKVLDLGLARFVDSGTLEDTLTQIHQAVGTPDFMAPEQLSESHSVDHRADVYALGATLYYLLSGQACFPTDHGAPIIEKAMKIAQVPPPKVRDTRTNVPTALENLLCRCLAKNPDERPQSAREVAESLEQFLASQNEVDGLSRDVQVQGKQERQKTVPLLIIAVAAVGLLLLLGSFVLRLNDPVYGQLTIDAPDGINIRATKIDDSTKTYVFSAEDEHSSLAIGTWNITIEEKDFDEFVIEGNGIIEIKDRNGATVRISKSPLGHSKDPLSDPTVEKSFDDMALQSINSLQPRKRKPTVRGMAAQPADLSDQFDFNRVLLRPVNAIVDQWAYGRQHFDIDPLGESWAYSTRSDILARNTSSGKVEVVFSQSRNGANWQNVQFSDDGKLLAGIDLQARIIEIRRRDGRLENRIDYWPAFADLLAEQSQHQIKWLPDGKSLLVWSSLRAAIFTLGGRPQAMINFSAERFNFPESWQGIGLHHRGFPPLTWSASIHPSGRRITFLFGSGDVMFWDWETNSLSKLLQVSHSIQQWAGLVWHPGGEKFLLWCSDEDVESNEATPVARIYGNDGSLVHQQRRNWQKATWAPSGDYLVTDSGLILSEDLETVKQLDFANHVQTSRGTLNTNITPFWKTEDIITFAYGDVDRHDWSGAISRFHPSGRKIDSFDTPQPLQVISASIDSDGNPVSIHQWDATKVVLYVWTQEGRISRRQEIELHTGNPTCDWSSDGRYVALRGRGTHVIVNVNTGKLARESATGMDRDRTAFSSDSSIIVYSSIDKDQTVLTKRGGKVIATFSGSEYNSGLEFSADDRWLSWHSDSDNQSHMWLVDLEQDNLVPVDLAKKGETAFGKISFSPDSKHLLYSRRIGTNDELVLLNLEDRSEQVVPVQWDPNQALFTCAWSPNSRQFFAKGTMEFGSDGKVEQASQIEQERFYTLACFVDNNNLLLHSSENHGVSRISLTNLATSNSKNIPLLNGFEQRGVCPINRDDHFIIARSFMADEQLVVIDSQTGNIRWTGTAFSDGEAIAVSGAGQILNGAEDLNQYIINVIKYRGGRTVPLSMHQFSDRINASPEQAAMLWLRDHNATLKFADNTQSDVLENIVGISLSGPEAGMPPKSLPALAELRLRFANIPNIPEIAHRENLKVLSLEGCTQVSNISLLADFHGLISLDLSGTGIAPKAGSTLRRLPVLRELSLRNTKIDAFTLLDLAKINTLESLDIRGTQIPSNAIADFRSRLPVCKVLTD